MKKVTFVGGGGGDRHTVDPPLPETEILKIAIYMEQTVSVSNLSPIHVGNFWAAL